LCGKAEFLIFAVILFYDNGLLFFLVIVVRGEFLFSKIIIGRGWTICDCNNSHGLRTGKLHMTFKDLPHVHIKELAKTRNG
jgi:hypothetical protein